MWQKFLAAVLSMLSVMMPGADMAVQERTRLFVPQAFRQDYILVAGKDARPGERGRADVLWLCSFDERAKRIGVLQVPRDSYVEIPGYGYDKINHSLALGGPELLRETVENLFGVNIDYYVVFDVEQAAKLLEILGPVEVENAVDMNYDDRAQGLSIHIPKGTVALSGKETVGFLRYRHDGRGDLGRMRRQQGFLLKAKEKLAEDPGLVLKLLWGFPKLGVTTNLPVNLLWRYGRLAAGFDLKIRELTGTGFTHRGVSYVDLTR